MGLAAQLRSLDDGRLAVLLTARRDLVEHPARTFEQLATRAATYGSQLACLSGLDLFLHELLELVALAGSPTTVDRVAELAGPNVTRAEIAEGFRRLHDLGLVALDASSVRLVGELTTRLGVPGLGRPARLLLNGRTVEELRRVVAALDVRPPLPSPRKADLLRTIAARLEDLPRLRQVLDAAPPEVGCLLESLDRQRSATLACYGSFGFGGRPRPSSDPRDRAIHWLLERGLLVQTTWGTAELIAEVGLLRRGGVPLPDISARPPQLAPVPHGVDVAGEAGAAASRVVDLLARLCHTLEGEPAPLLKTGGLGVRALRRLAGSSGLGEHDTATLVELAAAADLVRCAGGELRPGELSASWFELDVVDRWLHVLRSWLAARCYLRAAAAEDNQGRSVTPLTGAAGTFDVVRQRRGLLEALATVPPEHSVDSEILVAHLVWVAPHVWVGAPERPHVVATWFLEEAAFLGATAVGALAPAMRCELAGDHDGARDAATAAVPAQESGFIVQADLTVLALGTLDPRVAGGLGRFADVESRGGATVFRLSPTSIGRALQSGGSTSEILRFLGDHSRSAVPQPVEVLVADVGRRYGRVRVGGASSFLRCDDEALLTELVRHRRLAKLGLRQLAPSVAVSAATPETLLAEVAGAGYLPAEEDQTGTLVVRRPAAAASPGRGRGLRAGPGCAPPAPGVAPATSRDDLAAQVEALVRQLHGAEQPAPPAVGGTASLADRRDGDGRGRAGTRPGLAPPTLWSGPDDARVEVELDDVDWLEFTSDPAMFRAALQLAREEELAVGVGVRDDDGVVDLVGLPLSVRDGVVELRCADCADVHELGFEEIEWIDLLESWDDEQVDRREARVPAPTSATIGMSRKNGSRRR